MFEDEDESPDEIDVDGGLGLEAEILAIEKVSLEEVLVEVGSKVSGSSIVSVLEVNDENSAKELVEVSSAKSLVDVTVVAELRVDVADGDWGLLLAAEPESNDDVGLGRAESLDGVADVLLSTSGNELLDVLVGDRVSRPIVSKELEDNRDNGAIDVEVDLVAKVLEMVDSLPDDALADDVTSPSKLVVKEVEEAARSVRSLDDNVDVDEEISGDSPSVVVGSSVVETEVELVRSVSGFTVKVSLEEVKDSVKTSNDEDLVDTSELLDDVKETPTSEEVAGGVNESVEVDVVDDASDDAKDDGGSA